MGKDVISSKNVTIAGCSRTPGGPWPLLEEVTVFLLAEMTGLRRLETLLSPPASVIAAEVIPSLPSPWSDR